MGANIEAAGARCEHVANRAFIPVIEASVRIQRPANVIHSQVRFDQQSSPPEHPRALPTFTSVFAQLADQPVASPMRKGNSAVQTKQFVRNPISKSECHLSQLCPTKDDWPSSSRIIKITIICSAWILLKRSRAWKYQPEDPFDLPTGRVYTRSSPTEPFRRSLPVEGVQAGRQLPSESHF